jgi:hypothetical protein
MNRKLNSILKSLIIKSFAVLMMIGAMNSAVFSQETRIVLPRGKSSTTVSGNISWRGAHSYVLGASKGQKMMIRIASENSSVWADVDGSNIGKGRTIDLDSTGDYVITIHNDGGATNFSLYLEIR